MVIYSCPVQVEQEDGSSASWYRDAGSYGAPGDAKVGRSMWAGSARNIHVEKQRQGVKMFLRGGFEQDISLSGVPRWKWNGYPMCWFHPTMCKPVLF